jgi:hypothetical protein
MNVLLSRPVLDAMSVFISTAPSDLASEGRLPVSPFAPYRPIVVSRFGADSPQRWTYLEPQQLTHFPEFVTAFGERAFTAYWR